MGQRLNISIQKEGWVLANAYYHWSAYTTDAFELTKKIIEYYQQVKGNFTSSRELAVRLLEHTGAGINVDEHTRICHDRQLKKLRYLTATDRSSGLVAVTQEGLKETEHWEEARVVIDLYKEVVRFEVFNLYTMTEFKAEYADLIEPGGCYANLKEIDFHPGHNIPFKDISKLEEALANDDGVICGDWVYLWIE